MNENGALRLLAQANPIRLEDVPALDLTPESLLERSRPRTRQLLAVAVTVVVAGAAATIAVFAFPGSHPHPAPRIGYTPVGGINSPLPGPDAKRVSLAEATAALGAPVVLPDTSSASASDVGAVWMETSTGDGDTTDTAVAVTFPKQGFWVTYERQGPNVYYDNMLRHYEAIAHQQPDSSRVVDLDGVPALVGGDVELVAGGTNIRVIGKADEATLVAVARSIADRSESPPSGELGNVGGIQLYPYVPPAKQVALPDLSATLGAPVVLPDTSGLKPTGDARAWSGGTCPHPDGTGYWVGNRPTACWIWISFPGTSLSVGYIRPPIYKGTEGEWKLWTNSPGAAVVSLSGVPALVVAQNGPFPGWLEFDVDGTRILVGGDYDTAQLQAAAQSIVDGLRGQ